MNIYIAQKEFEKIRFWVEQARGEIGGFGEAETRDGEIYVPSVFLVKQEAGGAHVVYDDDAIANLVKQFKDKGDRVRFQWHSHASMGAFFSPVDTDNIEELNNGAWLASLVINKKEQSKARIDLFKPLRLQLDATIVPIQEVTDKEKTEWQKQYKTLVNEGETYVEGKYCSTCRYSHTKKEGHGRGKEIGFTTNTCSNCNRAATKENPIIENYTGYPHCERCLELFENEAIPDSKKHCKGCGYIHVESQRKSGIQTFCQTCRTYHTNPKTCLDKICDTCGVETPTADEIQTDAEGYRYCSVCFATYGNATNPK